LYSPADDNDKERLDLAQNCASVLRSDRQYREVEELQVQVMQTRKRVLGDGHPNTLLSIGNLALTYWDQGRWSEAEELQVQVMQTRKRVLGDEHPDTLLTMHNLAFSLQSQARHKEAIALMERCFQLQQQVLGEQHPYAQSLFETLSSWRLQCSNGSL
jgi:hypothetical protein